jgi:hypothetical protein
VVAVSAREPIFAADIVGAGIDLLDDYDSKSEFVVGQPIAKVDVNLSAGGGSARLQFWNEERGEWQPEAGFVVPVGFVSFAGLRLWLFGEQGTTKVRFKRAAVGVASKLVSMTAWCSEAEMAPTIKT